MSHPRFTGLTAAAHTPFHDDGSLNLSAIEKQAAHLAGTGVKSVFICGSTGESHSVTADERRQVAARWMEVAKPHGLTVTVHVGSNCLEDARSLAAHAQSVGAAGISMLSPSYFKPASVAMLVACCKHVAAAAPKTPFYYYDIPALTGVTLPMDEFLVQAEPEIPTLAGIKFTSSDLMQLQLCTHHAGGKFDIPYGCDEWMLAAVALGAKGAIGSTFNFAPGIYQRLLSAYAKGDMAGAQAEQLRSARLVKVVAARGYMGCAKALMRHLGVPVGPARLPQKNPSAAEVEAMLKDLEAIGYFSWWK